LLLAQHFANSKKRELVGNFKNPGRRWESAPCRVYDHDFRTDSIGVAIPYGIYDVTENRGALVVGVSHDTPTFAAHAIGFRRRSAHIDQLRPSSHPAQDAQASKKGTSLADSNSKTRESADPRK
jgi:DDE family transposase